MTIRNAEDGLEAEFSNGVKMVYLATGSDR